MAADANISKDSIPAGSSSVPILRLENLCKSFGGLKAVNDVTMAVQRDTLHSIIGPNGAGKTTLFNLISCRLQATSGKVFFEEQDITHFPQYRVAHLGIGRSYQITTVFLRLTVKENIRISVQALTSQFNFWKRADSIRSVNERTDEILEIIGLSDKRDLLAAQVGHAEQRQLDVGIALAANPRLLLLDEPTAGMSPVETEQIMSFVRKLAQSVTIILVEHKIKVVMAISDRVTVLNFGSVLAEGTPAEVQCNPRVQAAYLEGSV